MAVLNSSFNDHFENPKIPVSTLIQRNTRSPERGMQHLKQTVGARLNESLRVAFTHLSDPRLEQSNACVMGVLRRGIDHTIQVHGSAVCRQLLCLCHAKRLKHWIWLSQTTQIGKTQGASRHKFDQTPSTQFRQASAYRLSPEQCLVQRRCLLYTSPSPRDCS